MEKVPSTYKTPEAQEKSMQIERTSEVITNALSTHGDMFAKFGEIRAEVAADVTPVETVLSDGTKETKNVAQLGDFIVTNPGGERYVVKPEKFERLYQKADQEGVFTPRGQVVAVRNPYEKPISMMASWGELQHGAADCWIADTYNPVNAKKIRESSVQRNLQRRTAKRKSTCN